MYCWFFFCIRHDIKDFNELHSEDNARFDFSVIKSVYNEHNIVDTMSFQGPEGFLFVLPQVHWQAVGFVKVLPMIMLFWHPVLSFSLNGFYYNKLEFAMSKACNYYCNVRYACKQKCHSIHAPLAIAANNHTHYNNCTAFRIGHLHNAK